MASMIDISSLDRAKTAVTSKAGEQTQVGKYSIGELQQYQSKRAGVVVNKRDWRAAHQTSRSWYRTIISLAMYSLCCCILTR